MITRSAIPHALAFRVPVMIAKSERNVRGYIRQRQATGLGIEAPAASQAWIKAEPVAASERGVQRTIRCLTLGNGNLLAVYGERDVCMSNTRRREAARLCRGVNGAARDGARAATDRRCGERTRRRSTAFSTTRTLTEAWEGMEQHVLAC